MRRPSIFVSPFHDPLALAVIALLIGIFLSLTGGANAVYTCLNVTLSVFIALCLIERWVTREHDKPAQHSRSEKD